MIGGPTHLPMLLLGAALSASIVLGFYRVRRVIGYGPLYATMGAVQLSVLLSGDLLVDLLPQARPGTMGAPFAPATAVLVPMVPLALLVTYVRDGAHQARDLLLGLIAASVAGSTLLAVVAPDLAPPVLTTITRGLLVFFHALTVLLTYEVVGRLVSGLWLRTTAAFALALHADALLSAATSALTVPSLYPLYGRLAAATAGTLLYSGAACLYLYFLEDRAWTRIKRSTPLYDLMPVLTLRQRFGPMRVDTIRDTGSGVYSRVFFEDSLPIELDRAQQYGRHTSIVLVQLLDEPPSGIHSFMGRALMDALRMTDVPCRYDRHQYAAILPGADGRAAEASAERLQRALGDQLRARAAARGPAETPLPADAPPPTPFGVACYPDDGDTPAELLAAAQRRLKRAVARARSAPETPAV